LVRKLRLKRRNLLLGFGIRFFGVSEALFDLLEGGLVALSSGEVCLEPRDLSAGVAELGAGGVEISFLLTFQLPTANCFRYQYARWRRRALTSFLSPVVERHRHFIRSHPAAIQ
jgi:hypothetical protein